MSEKIKIVEQPKARHLCPSNRNRVIRPKKGSGYNRKSRVRTDTDD